MMVPVPILQSLNCVLWIVGTLHYLTQQHLSVDAIHITNDVNVTVNKQYYSSFQPIMCHVSSLLKAKKKGRQVSFLENVRIVSSKLLSREQNLWDIPDLVEYRSLSKLYRSKIDDQVNSTVRLYFDTIIGPPFYQAFNYDDMDMGPQDHGYTDLTVTNTSWNTANGRFQCIIVDDNAQTVLGASKPFDIGPPKPVSIQVNKTKVIPGEVLKVNFFSSNLSIHEDCDSGDYLRLYKVPYDLSANPFLFNSKANKATLVSSFTNFLGQGLWDFKKCPSDSSLFQHLVYFDTPGKYQFVLFSIYKQLVRGISNVFEIDTMPLSKNATVTVLNTTGIYPGQHVGINIYDLQRPPLDAKLDVAFIRAKDSVKEYLNETKRWTSMHDYGYWKWDNKDAKFDFDEGTILTWSSGTNNVSIIARYNSMLHGYYKAVILIRGKVIGVSKKFLVKPPFIQIPLPKRTFSYWELISFKDIIYNPYFQYSDRYDNEAEIFYSGLYFVSPNLTLKKQEPSYGQYPKFDGYQVTDIIDFPPGLYHIRYFKYYKPDWEMYALDYAIPIRNTTFRVVQNDVILKINGNKTRFKYGDTISYSLTTSKKVNLYGIYSIYTVPTDFKDYGSQWFDQVEQDIDPQSSDAIGVDLTVLNGKAEINIGNSYCFAGKPTFQLYATRSGYGDTKFYSQVLTIDQKTQPKECENYLC
jgi:hypothetical protein